MKRSNPITKISLGKALRLPIRRIKYYEAALTHPSYRNENRTEPLEDFDRLEFLGDAILNEVVCQRLYTNFSNADEGMLSKLRSILVSRRVLSRIAIKLKLQKWLRLGNSLREAFKTSFKTKLLTDAVESLFAAIFFDLGRVKAEAFILKHYDEYFDAKKLFRLDPNPKSTLQEFTLKKWKKLPEYKYAFSRRGVKTTVSAGRGRKATVFAKSKKEAELKAACALLRLLRQEKLKG
jgi:ribonuclease-3